MRFALVLVVVAGSLMSAGCSLLNRVDDTVEHDGGSSGRPDGAVGAHPIHRLDGGLVTDAEPPIMNPHHPPPFDGGSLLQLPDTHLAWGDIRRRPDSAGPTVDGEAPVEECTYPETEPNPADDDGGVCDDDDGGMCACGVAGECAPVVVEIDDCAGLETIRLNPSGSYRLSADIDCTGYDSGDGEGLLPLSNGAEGHRFTGSFDGDGHVIRGLRIVPDSGIASFNVGLFGFAEGAVIERVGLEDVYIEGGSGVGALVGNMAGSIIRECYATGTVIGVENIGGLVGGQYQGLVSDSYTKAMSVTASKASAGLVVGWLEGAMERTYSSGIAPGLLVDACELDCWTSKGAVRASFFDCEVSGNCTAPGGSSTAALTSLSTFTGVAAWNFDEVWGFFGPDGYPCLRWEPGCGCVAGRDSDGDGIDDCADSCVADALEGSDGDADCDHVLNCHDPDWPRPVRDCADLQNMRTHLSATHQLVADIDCTGFDSGDGMGFEPIGDDDSPFTGTLDGNGHTVEGLTILRPDRGDFTGLIGNAVTARVERIGLIDARVEGNRSVGTLIGGSKYATVSESFATGSVKGGESDVGGLVGGQWAGGTISDSYADVDVQADSVLGLLVGWQEGVIARCYASGRANPARLADTCPPVYCHDAAIEDSFFDCTIAGNCSAEGARPTSMMQVAATYIRVDWDFDRVWSQATTGSYPCLQWQAECAGR